MKLQVGILGCDNLLHLLCVAVEKLCAIQSCILLATATHDLAQSLLTRIPEAEEIFQKDTKVVLRYWESK